MKLAASAVQRLAVSLLAAAVVSDAFALPALPPLAGAAVPILIGGKLFIVPKVLLLKGGIGMAGLKIAGAQHLKSKVVASSTSAALSNLAGRLPQMPRIEVQEAAPPVKMLPEFEHTFHVPAVPMPALQWYKKPLTLTLPKLVLRQPSTLQKTITIDKHMHQHDSVVNEPAPVVADAPVYNAPPELYEVGYDAVPDAQDSASSYEVPLTAENVASEESVPAPEAGPEHTNEFPHVNESFQ